MLISGNGVALIVVKPSAVIAQYLLQSFDRGAWSLYAALKL